MARPRRQPRERAKELDWFQRSERMIGDSPGYQSRFSSEQARRAAWREHRDEIIVDYIDQQPGRRPWAFWIYDAPAEIAADERRLRFDPITIDDRMRLDQDLDRRKLKYLLTAGLLTGSEIDVILTDGERGHASPDARQAAEAVRQAQVQSLVASATKGQK